MLVILASGDRTVYEDCSSCFQAMGKTSFFLGEVGNAARMMLILNMVQGSFMATIAEGLTLAQATGQSQHTFLDILSQGQMASTFVDQKCQSESQTKTLLSQSAKKYIISQMAPYSLYSALL
uniref:3-hydroxyisobutyrate dehydrogenase-like NAD-binding domain-containing protein n=1 Tax=Hucho hucho TaxID=62062 RepID=A0A4W5LHI3_9TELE